MIDAVDINIKSGDGGNGAVSFCTFPHLSGPDGGSGGRGGDVIFRTDTNMSTLADFRHKKNFFAQNGKNGASKRSNGKSGDDLFINVPCGTIISDIKNGAIMCDMDCPNMEFIAAKGGKGGLGNSCFKSSVNRAPKYAQEGFPGEYFEIRLELKLLADVALIGMPNAGKSTILSIISNAKPKIANYPFTTLSPILGVVQQFGKSFVMADIPGLIEGASEGIGLGHQFLKHIQRCKLLVHVVDISDENAISNFEVVNNEVKKFDDSLAKFPMVVIANKIDVSNEEQILKFENYIKSKNVEFFKVSAKRGISDLDSPLRRISYLLDRHSNNENQIEIDAQNN